MVTITNSTPIPRPLLLRSGAIAAFVAAALLLVQLIIGYPSQDAIRIVAHSFDPDVVAPLLREYQTVVTQLILADDLFALAYGISFAILALYLMLRARALATLALVFALGTALVDLTENSLTLATTGMVTQGLPLETGTLLTLFWLGQLKYFSIYLAGILFAIGLWGDGRDGRLLAILLLLFPLIGLGSLAFEGLATVALLWMLLLLVAGGIFMWRRADGEAQVTVSD